MNLHILGYVAVAVVVWVATVWACLASDDYAVDDEAAALMVGIATLVAFFWVVVLPVCVASVILWLCFLGVRRMVTPRALRNRR